jgi:5'-methylthioadenosine phosphorylase
VPTAEIGVFGGSGFYSLLDDVEEREVETPFGAPSGPIAIGDVEGTSVAFLPRHGKNHQFPPHRIPYRANVWAMRELGVRRLIGPNASGALKAELARGEFVVCDQYVDRTSGRPDTFYDGPQGAAYGADTQEARALPVPPSEPTGRAASRAPTARTTHVSAADPFCPELRRLFVETATELGIPVRDGGTVVVTQGPRFSTRAESRWFQGLGWDVINMTAYPECHLSRELELCYVNVSMVTDHDVGVEGQEPVSAEAVVRVFNENNERLRALLYAVIPKIGPQPDDVCANALRGARL